MPDHNSLWSFTEFFKSLDDGACLHEVEFDNKADPIDYIIRDVNKAFENITGIKRKSAINKKGSNLYKQHPPPYFKRYIETALTGKSDKFSTFYPPLKKHFTIKVFSPRKNWFVTLFTDITDFIEKEEKLISEKNLLKSYLENAPHGVFITDQNGNYIDINKRACDITGYSKEELLKMNISDTGIKEDAQIQKKRFNFLKEKGFFGEDVNRFKRKDGSIGYWSLSAVKISDTKYIGFTRDITEKFLIKRREKRVAEIVGAITEVNRVVSKAVSNYYFIDEICKVLTKFKIYNHIWIVIYDKNGDYLSSSFSKNLQVERDFIGKLKDGTLPHCIEILKNTNSIISIKNPDQDCHDCVFKVRYSKKSIGISVKLQRDKRVYGYLNVSIDPLDSELELEQNFLLRMSADVCQGLINIENYNEKNSFLNEIFEYSRELSAIYNSVPLMMLVVDKGRRVRKVNSFTEQITGLKESDLIGLRGGDSIGCVNNKDSAHGCGYGEKCKACFINNAVKKTLMTGESCSQVEGQIKVSYKGKYRNLDIIVSTSLLKYSHEDNVLVVIDDVSNLVKANKEIKEKEFRLTQLVENMKSGVIVYEFSEKEDDFIFKEFNRAAEKIDKIKRVNLIGKPVKKIFPGIEVSGLYDCFKRVYKTGCAQKTPMLFYEDQRISGWRDNYVYRLENNEIVVVYDDVTGKIISDQKLTENSILIESINLLLTDIISGKDTDFILDNILKRFLKIFPDLRSSYYILNKEGFFKVVKSFNGEGLEDINGLSFKIESDSLYFKKIMGNGIVECSGNYDDKIKLNIIKQDEITSILDVPVLLEGYERGIFSFFSNEQKKWSVFQKNILEETASLFSIHLRQRDAEIKRRKISLDLEKREKEYRGIFNNSPVGIFKTTIKGDAVTVNPAMAKILGCKTPEETVQKYSDISENLYADPIKKNELVSLLKKNKRVDDFEFEAKKVDKTRAWIEMSAALTDKNQDGYYYVEGFAKDITEQKKAEDELKASNEKFSRVFYKSSSLMGISDIESGEYFDINESFLNTVEFKKGEVIGKTSLELGIITPETRKAMIEELNKNNGKVDDLEIEFFTKTGKKLNGLFSADIVEIDSEKRLLSNIFDITDRKRLQEETLRAGHLASIGELAAGVAHEINNPINGIINYAQILKDEMDDTGGDSDIPNRIILEGDRVSEIVKNLLVFSRAQKEDFSPIDLSSVLKDTLYIAGAQLRKDGITLENNYSSKLPEINGKARELQQVFLNLLSNSRYSLNSKYTESVEGKKIIISGKEISIDGKKYVRIEFCDFGKGIPLEIISKIQNPFFSTKPKGKGTGLGLSLSRGIIDKHFGFISFESVENEFAKVMIDLPKS